MTICVGGVAAGSFAKGGPSAVAALVDDGISAVGCRSAGNGALYAGDAGQEPSELAARRETAADLRNVAGLGKQDVRRE